MHAVDQPAADNNDNADCLEICQPLGLGPATNWTVWVAVVPRADVAVTSALATPLSWSMLATLKVSGNLPSAAALLEARSAAMLPIRPIPPRMQDALPMNQPPPARA